MRILMPFAGISWREIANLAIPANTLTRSSSGSRVRVRARSQMVPKAWFQPTKHRARVQISRKSQHKISTRGQAASSLQKGTAEMVQVVTSGMLDCSSFYFRKNNIIRSFPIDHLLNNLDQLKVNIQWSEQKQW